MRAIPGVRIYANGGFIFNKRRKTCPIKTLENSSDGWRRTMK